MGGTEGGVVRIAHVPGDETGSSTQLVAPLGTLTTTGTHNVNVKVGDTAFIV